MPSDKGKRILIVDDEVPFCETLKARLETFGYSVAAATSAREAWQQVASHSPDLIVLDIRMPEEDGYTFLRKLRAYRDSENPEREEKLRHLPVIICTGVGEGMKTLFEQEQVAAYICKPIDSAALRKLIEENT